MLDHLFQGQQAVFIGFYLVWLFGRHLVPMLGSGFTIWQATIRVRWSTGINGGSWFRQMVSQRGTARVESASRRDVGQRGHHPGDLVQAGAGLQAAGKGLDQSLRIRMFRIVDHPVGEARFHDFAGVHDGDFFGHLGHHPQVVGDEDQPRIFRLAQLLQQIHDFGLDGHVQGRGGFVGDNDFRVGDQGDGDDDALAHAAGKFMGILGQAFFR